MGYASQNKSIEKQEMSSKMGQGFVSSCVGPVVDISMSSQNHEIYQLQAQWVSLGITSTLGLPCIYDSLILIRPECSFREGIMMPNQVTSKRAFFEELNKEGSLALSLMACCNIDYYKIEPMFSWSNRENMHGYHIRDEILANSHGEAVIGLASVLILVKAYANWLLVEVNQICYGGVLRTIALGFTEGISSWKVEALCTFQPLVVPVGRSTLGRLFSVLGATIDAYVGIDELPIYSDYAFKFDQCEAGQTTNTYQRVQFTRDDEDAETIKLWREEELSSVDILSTHNSMDLILDIFATLI